MLGFWWARSGVDVNAAHAVLSDNGTLVANTLSSCNLKLFCCLCLLSFLIIAEIDNSLGILQNCKMTKVMKICDKNIVWLLVQLGAEAHFRDALIVEQILDFTLIWDLHCTLLLIIFTTLPPGVWCCNHHQMTQPLNGPFWAYLLFLLRDITLSSEILKIFTEYNHKNIYMYGAVINEL